MKSFAIALVLFVVAIAILALTDAPWLGWGVMASALIPLGMSLVDHCDPIGNL